MSKSWTMTHYARPWTINSERAGGKGSLGGKYGRAAKVKEWREVFYILAIKEKIPPLKSVEVEAWQVSRDNRLSDCGSMYGTLKACIDGIVDAGVLPNDGPKFVTYIGMHAPYKGEKDAVVVEIRGEPA